MTRMRKTNPAQISPMSKVLFKFLNVDFPGFGNYGDDELNDEDDVPDMKDEHVHGENCNHEHEKKSSLDDLDEEANK